MACAVAAMDKLARTARPRNKRFMWLLLLTRKRGTAKVDTGCERFAATSGTARTGPLNAKDYAMPRHAWQRITCGTDVSGAAGDPEAAIRKSVGRFDTRHVRPRGALSGRTSTDPM